MRTSSVSPHSCGASLNARANAGARTDGIATNTISATLQNENGELVSNSPLVFSIVSHGNALFVYGSTQMQVNTDNWGIIRVDLTDTSAEIVSINVYSVSLKLPTMASTAFIKGIVVSCFHP